MGDMPPPVSAKYGGFRGEPVLNTGTELIQKIKTGSPLLNRINAQKHGRKTCFKKKVDRIDKLTEISKPYSATGLNPVIRTGDGVNLGFKRKLQSAPGSR
jgi:hypothetical protein